MCILQKEEGSLKLMMVLFCFVFFLWFGLLGLELHKGNDVPDTLLEVVSVRTYILQLCWRESGGSQ